MKKCLLFLLLSATFSLSGQNRPNILFIAADDLNNALGCYGNKIVKTPNIDRLAKRSVKFDKAYTQFPWCSPSRSSMLTGLRPDSIKIFNLKTHFRTVKPDVVTLPQLYKNNGYHAARVGKIYHYGNPSEIGTNGLDDAPSWHEAINPKGIDREEEKLLTNYSENRNWGSALAYHASNAPDEQHTDGLVAKNAIDLLSKNKNNPFFLAVGFYRPHCPFIAPKKYFDLYPLENIKLPIEPDNDLDDVPEVARRQNEFEKKYTETQRKELIRAYYASVSFLDANVGKVLDALDSLKLSDNTIIVFWSDHGYHIYEHQHWMKRTLFEESCRIPMMIAAPNIRPNNCPAVVEQLDLYPTLAALSNLTPPDVHGKSLVPLMKNPKMKWNYPAFTQVDRYDENKQLFFGRSIRTKEWRYSEWDVGKKGVELYDHKLDPKEFTNLANDPKYQKVIAKLQKRLRQQR